jgi:hypothetical protein
MKKAEKLKQRFEDSGNVLDCELKDMAEIDGEVEERKAIELTLEEDGYGFDLICAEFPSFRVRNVYCVSGEIHVTATVKQLSL